MHLSTYRHSTMDYRQRVCPHGIKTDWCPILLCIPIILAIRCHDSFPFGALTRKETTFLVVQAYSLGVRTVNLRSVFPTRPFDTCPVAKVNPHLGMSSSGPQGFQGKSPHPIGVVFCLKNLPYPLCDLLESHRNETNGDRNTQKKRRIHGVRTQFNRNSLHSS